MSPPNTRTILKQLPGCDMYTVQQMLDRLASSWQGGQVNPGSQLKLELVERVIFYIMRWSLDACVANQDGQKPTSESYTSRGARFFSPNPQRRSTAMNECCLSPTVYYMHCSTITSLYNKWRTRAYPAEELALRCQLATSSLKLATSPSNIDHGSNEVRLAVSPTRYQRGPRSRQAYQGSSW